MPNKFRFSIPPFSNYVVLARFAGSVLLGRTMIRTPEQCNHIADVLLGSHSDDQEAVRKYVWSLGRRAEFIPNYRGEHDGLNELFEGEV